MDDHLSQIRAIIGRYLDGEQSFEDAANALKRVLRAAGAGAAATPELPPPQRITLKTLSPSEWMNPPKSPSFEMSPLELAPGRSPKDEARARALYIRALRLALRQRGDAA